MVMKINKHSVASVLIMLFCSCIITAQIKLSSPFGEHMVLQQGMTVPVWGTASPGEKVSVTIDHMSQTTKALSDGKWKVSFLNLKAGGPYEMKIKGKNTITFTDVYVGEVWLCSGQSNMDMTVAKENRYWCGVFNEAEEVASANYPLIREFYTKFSPSLEPKTEVEGKWEVCSPATVGHFQAAPYFFGRNLFQKMNVPIGLLVTTFGASTAEAWTSSEALTKNPDITFLLDNFKQKVDKFNGDSANTMNKYRKAVADWKGDTAKARAENGDVQANQNRKIPRRPGNPAPWLDQHSPTVLYNGMVAPLASFAIRGAIWYQGESNGPTAKQYRILMETLIADWRKKWEQGDFPFIYVQLANHQDLITEPVKDDPMVFVREGQLQNLSISNTAMVVAIDNADPKDPGNIHPKNKQAIGLRLAMAARGLVYKENITYMGPIYDKMVVEDSSIRIYFKSIGEGLEIKGDKLTGFAIAGEDKKFVWGNAKIDGNTIIISSPEVSKPLAVRYCWAKNPSASLYNKANLPASPFRTDNW
jgi:sialate O-acetylesterase